MTMNIEQLLRNPIPVRTADDVTVHIAPVSVSTTSTTIAPANPLRSMVTIQNQDATLDVYITVDVPATANIGYRVAAGADVSLPGGQVVNAIAESGTVALNVSWVVRNG